MTPRGNSAAVPGGDSGGTAALPHGSRSRALHQQMSLIAHSAAVTVQMRSGVLSNVKPAGLDREHVRFKPEPQDGTQLRARREELPKSVSPSPSGRKNQTAYVVCLAPRL